MGCCCLAIHSAAAAALPFELPTAPPPPLLGPWSKCGMMGGVAWGCGDMSSTLSLSLLSILFDVYSSSVQSLFLHSHGPFTSGVRFPFLSRSVIPFASFTGYLRTSHFRWQNGHQVMYGTPVVVGSDRDQRQFQRQLQLVVGLPSATFSLKSYPNPKLA